MSYEQAKAVLDLVRNGDKTTPLWVITQALILTGDIEPKK